MKTILWIISILIFCMALVAGCNNVSNRNMTDIIPHVCKYCSADYDHSEYNWHYYKCGTRYLHIYHPEKIIKHWYPTYCHKYMKPNQWQIASQ
jgi:hypothetical protein